MKCKHPNKKNQLSKRNYFSERKAENEMIIYPSFYQLDEKFVKSICKIFLSNLSNWRKISLNEWFSEILKLKVKKLMSHSKLIQSVETMYKFESSTLWLQTWYFCHLLIWLLKFGMKKLLLLRLSKSTSLTPVPLSETEIDFSPWSCILMSIFVAFASRAFSKSSFRAIPGFKMTCQRKKKSEIQYFSHFVTTLLTWAEHIRCTFTLEIAFILLDSSMTNVFYFRANQCLVLLIIWVYWNWISSSFSDCCFSFPQNFKM